MNKTIKIWHAILFIAGAAILFFVIGMMVQHWSLRSWLTKEISKTTVNPVTASSTGNPAAVTTPPTGTSSNNNITTTGALAVVQ